MASRYNNETFYICCYDIGLDIFLISTKVYEAEIKTFRAGQSLLIAGSTKFMLYLDDFTEHKLSSLQKSATRIFFY